MLQQCVFAHIASPEDKLALLTGTLLLLIAADYLMVTFLSPPAGAGSMTCCCTHQIHAGQLELLDHEQCGSPGI